MNYTSRLIVSFAVILVVSVICACSENGASDSSNPSTGKAGSMTRFLLINDYLYTLAGQSQLKLFDIREPSNPNIWANVVVDFGGVETLFENRGYLFMGTTTGVNIYDNRDPANPVYVSRFSHMRSCDPVVVQGNYAFSTLRSGNRCANTLNQLDVINISDISNPVLEKSYAMVNPKGLGVDSDKLFVCDDQAGLKVYGANDPLNLTVLDVRSEIDCYDVISDRNALIVSDAWGILQLDYSTLPLSKISEIPLQ